MIGSGDKSEGRPTTVFVFEYVTGGGLSGRDLPRSWAAEGAAMRRAIAEDFAAVPGVRVVSTVDARLPAEEMPGLQIQRIADQETGWFESLAAESDYTVLIAPETDRILSRLIDTVARVGGRSIGSSVPAVNFVSDKARLAHHFVCEDIPSPPTRIFGSMSQSSPDDWDSPIVFKPRRGAGSVDTIMVRDRILPNWLPRDESFVVQPYLPGQPMSASFLVDSEGVPTILGVGRQRVDVDSVGKISYQGGTILAGRPRCPAVVQAAVVSLIDYLIRPNLRGFVGVDFLLDDRGAATILEVNPRPTTSYVGLARQFPPGTIAGAWLAAADGPLAGTGWPDRLRIASHAPPVLFDADGTTHPRTGDDLP